MTESECARLITRLVEDHYEVVYRFAYRLSGSAADAEDLTQQAFLTAQEKLEQLRDTGKARSWLLTIVRNLYLKVRRRADVVSSSTVDLLEAVDTPESDGHFDEEVLQAALLEMPEEFRVAVILFYFDEMSYQQIAEHLNIPAGTVMSRLSRGKAFLRKRLSRGSFAENVVTSASSS